MSRKTDSSTADSEFSCCSFTTSVEDNKEFDMDVFKTTLYEGSKLSIGRSCLLIVQFYRKYGLPRIAVNDLLTLIALHCPEKIEN